MKRVQVQLAALATLAIAAGLISGRAQDMSPEEANLALVRDFQAAWNKHDIEGAFRKLLTDDVDWVNVNASRGKGIDSVVQGHARAHAGTLKDSVFTVKDVEIALLKPDVALVYVSWAMKGNHDDDGTPREPREGLFTWVTVKDGAAWKIRASQNTNKTAVH